MRKNKASGTKTNIGRDALTELALDLRWWWHHGADEVWSEIDPELWALTHNPWVVLQVASPARLGALDPECWQQVPGRESWHPRTRTGTPHCTGSVPAEPARPTRRHRPSSRAPRA